MAIKYSNEFKESIVSLSQTGRSAVLLQSFSDKFILG